MASTTGAWEPSSSRSPRKGSYGAATPLIELLATAKDIAAAKKGGEATERLDKRSKVRGSTCSLMNVSLTCTEDQSHFKKQMVSISIL